jgi:sec-independent protein translocase protein TatC
MAKFFRTFWRVIRFPFVLIFNIIAFPFRGIGAISRFLNEEPPEDRPLIDTFSSLATEQEARASLWEHVEALRKTLLWIIIGVAVGVGISFFFTRWLMNYLAQPIGGLDKLINIQVTEGIGVYMRVALTSGIALALPYIAFQLWLFAAPGLRPRERKMGLLGIPLAAILFLMGIAFTYYLLLPSALPFLANFTKIQQLWTANNYFGFVTALMLWIGLFFEFPLVIYILTSIGFVQPQALARQWRLAIVIIAIIAAVITPTVDPVNMTLVMLPMILLYFISIGLSYIAYAGRGKANLESAQQEKPSV